MKKLFKKLGFRKMDEMEKEIAIKSQRNALIVVISALFVWSIIESIKIYQLKSDELNHLPSMLLVITVLVEIVSQLIYKRRMVGSKTEQKIVSILPLAIIGAVIILGITIGILLG